MHRFNVATFVNILIVGLVATTISLFVFGGPGKKAAFKAGYLSESAVADVESAENRENAALSETAAVENVLPESEERETEVASESEVELDSVFVLATLDSETEVASESEVELDSVFAS
ncbi:MAG: hypothetical protein IKY61_07445, partial [Thermoguttaceae bacterium]|nr:hypothetical protein [Thermoguttaceae bacterium]